MNAAQRDHFRQVALAHLGGVLTPEVLAELEMAAFYLPPRPVDPAQFEPVTHGAYTIQVERFEAILGELKPLHEAHWIETEGHRHGLELRPDYEQLVARESAGRLVQFTVRRQDELCGHLLMYLGPSVHTQTIVAEEDCLYMRPEHRGGFTAMALLRYAEVVLTKIGVREIRANSKVVNHADVLMRRMRYQQVAIQFVKILSP